MGRVVDVSSEAMNYHLYGDNSNFMMGYLNSQLESLGQFGVGMGNAIYDSIQRGISYVQDTVGSYHLHDELSKSGLTVLDNYFQAYDTIEGLQQATPVMQRYITAHIPIKKLYINQDIHGYEGTYLPNDPKTFGEEDYDWRRVNNGLIVCNPEDDTYEIRHYSETLLPGDRELNHYEQDLILDTWEAIDMIMKESKIDFTNPNDDPGEMNI